MKLAAVNYQVLDLKMAPCVLLNTLSVANIAGNGVSMEHWQKYTDRENGSARRETRSVPLCPLQLSFSMALN